MDICDAFIVSQGVVCTRLKIRPSLLKPFEINIMEVARNADEGGNLVFELMALVGFFDLGYLLVTLSFYANFKTI